MAWLLPSVGNCYLPPPPLVGPHEGTGARRPPRRFLRFGRSGRGARASRGRRGEPIWAGRWISTNSPNPGRTHQGRLPSALSPPVGDPPTESPRVALGVRPPQRCVVVPAQASSGKQEDPPSRTLDLEVLPGTAPPPAHREQALGHPGLGSGQPVPEGIFQRALPPPHPTSLASGVPLMD